MTVAAAGLRLRPYAGLDDVVDIVRIVNAGIVAHDRSVAMRKPLLGGQA